MAFGRSKRTTIIEPPAPVNWITGRPFGEEPPPVVDDRDLAERAEGQRALATATVPTRAAVGFNPAASAWRGCDDVAAAKRARGE